jgi:hypothetical protein
MMLFGSLLPKTWRPLRTIAPFAFRLIDLNAKTAKVRKGRNALIERPFISDDQLTFNAVA